MPRSQDRLISVWSHRYNDLLELYSGTLPTGASSIQIEDFNQYIQSGDYREIGLALPEDQAAMYRHEPHECSAKSSIFEYKNVSFLRMYGGPDDDDHYYYYNGSRFAQAFQLPASAMITECTVLLPMIGDISQPDNAVMQFMESYYPGYVMGFEDHRSDDEVKHTPDVIEDETYRIVNETYAEDIRLWELVQNGTVYYPPNYLDCTAKLPDGSRAVPPSVWRESEAKARVRGRRGVAERSLQP